MAEFVTAREAARKIPDGATVGFAGMGLSGWPEAVARAVAENYREEGHPRDLNLKQGSALGDWNTRGITVLGEEGLVTRWSAAHVGSAFKLRDLAVAEKLQCHCLPQGVIVNLWREIAAGRPGLITKTGLGTFVDPRVEGGKMNRSTTDSLVELIEFGGEEYLFYKSFPVHVAVLRGTTADEKGNISCEHESVLTEALAVAQAAKRCGGIVIVQVEYIAKAGTINPKDVRIPGILVDYVVVAQDKDCCWQTEGVYYEPAFSGQIKKPLDAIPVLPLSERKVIARRCAMELRAGDVVNLGVGLSSDVSNVVSEEGYIHSITLTAESGAVGGVPASLPNFGSSYNADMIMGHGDMFDLIDGGNLDITFLGIGEVDRHGNNNVSKLGTRLTGPGGFINISQATPKIVFCGTLMNKATFEFPGDGIRVVDQGTQRKFVEQVQQITFAGQYARPDQEVLYVTERCVFRLEGGRMVLIEIAPGCELERDVLANIAFEPVVSPALKTMDPALFAEHWGKLGETIQ